MGRFIRSGQQEIFHREADRFFFNERVRLRMSRSLDDIENDGAESGCAGSEGAMKREEILSTLTSCGLSEYESKAYASLVFIGPSKAGEISRDSNVPQSKIYEILDQLMDKQLVEMFDGRPKEFKAVEPETALRNLLEERSRELDALKGKVEAMSEFLKPTKPTEVTGGVWTIKGEKFKEFFNKAAEMMARSERYVYAITRDFSRSEALVEALRKCKKRGVKIRVIGMEKIDESNYYKAKWYADHGIDVRVFETRVHPRIIVADGREMLLRLDYEPEKRNGFLFSSLWSEDASLVAVMDSYAKNMWNNAKPVNLKNIQVPL
jgi:sugar-specific transcriptional regulator TrmB